MPLKKVFNFQMDYKCNYNGNISCVAFMGHMKGIPLPLLFRAFGVSKDADIYQLVCPDVYAALLEAQRLGVPTNSVRGYDVFNLMNKIIQESKTHVDGMRQKIKNYLETREIIVKAQTEQQKRKEYEKHPQTTPGVHAHRAARRDRDHRDLGGHAPPRARQSQSQGATHRLHQQPQAGQLLSLIHI
jgi:DNA-directed RNA polymerase beta subunit